MNNKIKTIKPKTENLLKFLKNKAAGKNNNVINIWFKKKKPNLSSSCKFSIIEEKL